MDLPVALLASWFALHLGGEEPNLDSPAPAPAWSQWRGPDRDGAAPGPEWPESLGDDHLRPRWRVQDLGPSYSGPVTDGELLFTTATVDREREVVQAYALEGGELVWETDWAGAMQVPFFAQKNGSWIRSTPTVVDGVLYVAGIRDVLVAMNASDGEILWRRDFPGEMERPLPNFGTVCSPLVVDGRLYLQAGAALLALDAQTGETVWESLRDEGGMMGSAFSSPVLAEVEGEAQLLVQTRAELCAVSPEDGDLLWNVAVPTFRGMNILTPQPWGDAIFTSAYGGRGHLYEPGRGEDGAWEIGERWENHTQAYMTSPVVIDDHAYLFLRSNRFTCVRLSDGEVAWTTPPTGDEYWSLVYQGDRILTLSDTGRLRLIAADPKEYRVLSERELEGEANTWAHLAVWDGHIAVRELHGLSLLRWE